MTQFPLTSSHPRVAGPTAVHPCTPQAGAATYQARRSAPWFAGRPQRSLDHDCGQRECHRRQTCRRRTSTSCLRGKRSTGAAEDWAARPGRNGRHTNATQMETHGLRSLKGRCCCPFLPKRTRCRERQPTPEAGRGILPVAAQLGPTAALPRARYLAAWPRTTSPSAIGSDPLATRWRTTTRSEKSA
jgi:hypothetical protein